MLLEMPHRLDEGEKPIFSRVGLTAFQGVTFSAIVGNSSLWKTEFQRQISQHNSFYSHEIVLGWDSGRKPDSPFGPAEVCGEALCFSWSSSVSFYACLAYFGYLRAYAGIKLHVLPPHVKN